MVKTRLIAVLILRDGHVVQSVRFKHTNAIHYVMKNGRLYDGNTLDEVWPRTKPLGRMWWWGEEPTTK